MAGLRWRCRGCGRKMRHFDLTCEPCKRKAAQPEPDATPDEARRILEDLHRMTSAPAPLFDLPFSLQPQVNRGGRAGGQQGGLFDE